MAAMLKRPSRLSLHGIRLSLALGYGGLLGLLVFLGAYSARTLSRVQKVEAQSSRVYVERSDRLEAVLSAAYSASARVRDYLLDPDPHSNENHREAARRGWADTVRALAEYKRVAVGAHRALTTRLETDIASYWEVAGESLELRGAGRELKGYGVLTTQLGPLRDRLLATLNEIRVLDQRDLRASIDEAAAELDALRTRQLLVVVFSVLLGVVLAAATWSYLLRLERAAQQQYRASVEFAANLEELSQRVLSIQEEERRKLARELHDEVGQTLGALLVDLGQASGELKGPGGAAQRVDSAHRLAETAMSTVRNMTLLLRPSMLDDLGLVPALYWQARETSRRTGMDVRVNADEEELELPDPLRTTIYRVVQEALQNAARHSRAKSVEIVLRSGEGRLRMLIRDDGHGFDPKTTKGIGLLGMHERVSQLGGELVVESAPGRGTVIKMELPLQGEDGLRA